MNDEHVRLGKTDIQVRALGIGAWAWGDRMVWGYGNGYAEADVKAAFETAVEGGIDFYDTAEIYGNGESERLLGKFARESSRRVAVATKFFPYPWRLQRREVVSALRKSLERLGMKQVDLYQIHQPLPPVAVETWMEGLADAVEAGLTRAVGVSNYDARQTRRAYEELRKRGIPLATNQIRYSLLHREPERNGLVETCRELGVTIIAYSPLAQGLLTGKYTPERRPPGVRGWRSSRGYLEQIQPLVELERQIGAAHGGKTPGQVALNWAICKGTVPIPGAKNARQAQENDGALGWRLTEAEVAALDAESDKIGKRR